MPLHLHVATPTTRLQSSIRLYLPVTTPTTRLQSCIPPCLYVATPSRVSRPLCFCPYIPPRRYTYGATPNFRASTSRDIYSTLPDIQASLPPRRYTYIEPPDLYPLYLRVCTLVEHLQSSRAPYLHASSSTRQHRTSRAPYLHTPPSLHLQRTSRRISRTLYLHISPSLHLQCGSRAPEPPASTSAHQECASGALER